MLLVGCIHKIDKVFLSINVISQSLKMNNLNELVKQRDELQKQIDIASIAINQPEKQVVVENKYLIMGFWEFAIISTLTIVFFPWSLLYCVIAYGLADTKLLVLALFHDFLKTLFAVLMIVLPIVGLLVYFVLSSKNII